VNFVPDSSPLFGSMVFCICFFLWSFWVVQYCWAHLACMCYCIVSFSLYHLWPWTHPLRYDVGVASVVARFNSSHGTTTFTGTAGPPKCGARSNCYICYYC